MTDSVVGRSVFELPRRHLLIGGAAGIVAASALSAPPASAAIPRVAAPSVAPALSVISAVPVAVLTTGFASSSIIEVPSIVGLSWPTAWARRMIVTTSYDPRVLVAGDRAEVTQDQNLVQSVPVSASTQGKLAVATFTMTLAARDRPIGVSVALPMRARRLFPQEDVGPSLPISVTVAEAGGQMRSFTAANSSSTLTPVSAWGLELYGIWTHVDVRQKGSGNTSFRYRHPIGVEVVSLGPAASPIDAAVSLAVDARIIGGYRASRRDVSAKAVPWSAAASVSGDVLSTVVPVGRSLSAGERLRIDFTPTERETRPLISSLRNATLSVVSGETPGLWRRATPNDTVVDLTASGRAGVEHEAMGTI